MIVSDKIISEQMAKFDQLLSDINDRLELVEGVRCNRYPPTFNIANHPYWADWTMPVNVHLWGSLV